MQIKLHWFPTYIFLPTFYYENFKIVEFYNEHTYHSDYIINILLYVLYHIESYLSILYRCFILFFMCINVSCFCFCFFYFIWIFQDICLFYTMIPHLILICISLMTNDLGHSSRLVALKNMYSFYIYIWCVFSDHLSNLSIELSFFFWNCRNALYSACQTFVRYMLCEYFLCPEAWLFIFFMVSS